MNLSLDLMFPIEKIDFFSITLYCFNWLLIGYIFIFNYKKHGIFSFSSIWVFFSFCLGIQLPFFFAFSDLNSISSSDIYLYSYLTNDTFLISSIGFYFFFIGVLFSKKINFVPIGLNFTYRCVCGFVKRRFINYFFFVFIVIGIVILIVLGVPFGEGRNFAMEHHNIRPIINLFTSIYVFLFFLVFLVMVYNKQPFYYVFFILLFFLNLWSGTRSALLMPIVFMIATFSILNKNRKLFKYIIYAVVILFLAFFIKAVRDGIENVDGTIILSEFFFGNTFSDLRDFTWVYYYWDSDYLFGKTYLSGILSFIPSSISEYRELWSWGRWSTGITYLNSLVHPGLRPGSFGEIFFNFGYFGVMFLGLFLGLCIGRLDKILQLIRNSDEYDRRQLFVVIGAFFVYYGIISSITISAGYFNIYLKLFVLIFGLVSLKK